MYHIQCTGCGTQEFLFCTCPAAVTSAGEHLTDCRMADPDGRVVCPPDSGCCQDDHSGEPGRRGHAVLACPVDHSSAPCPDPQGCRLHTSKLRHWSAMADHQAAGQPHELVDAVAIPVLPPDCPGGHHGLGVDGCLVCRELVITAIPGAAMLTAAAS